MELTAENARLRGLPDPEQLALAELRALEQRRAQLLAPIADTTAAAKPSRPPRPGHGPRSQPALPVVEIRHQLAPDQRACPACGGELTEMTGQPEDSGGAIAGAVAERIGGANYRQLVEELLFAALGGRAAFGKTGLAATPQPWGHMRTVFGMVMEVTGRHGRHDPARNRASRRRLAVAANTAGVVSNCTCEA